MIFRTPVDFSDKWVRGLNAPTSDHDEYRDVRIKGLRLLVYPGGRITWTLLYRRKGDQKLRREKIGVFGIFNTDAARIEALRILTDAARGRDLQAERKEHDSSLTFRAIVEGPQGWLERHAKINKRSWKTDEQRLAGPLEKWGDRKAADIARKDVVALLDEIVDRGAATQANRTLAVLRTVFRWAVSRDLITSNPCYLVKAPAKERKRDRILTDDEIRAFWGLTEAFTPSMRGIWRMRLATGQRGQECRLMRWADVDEDKRLWTIPAEDAKNGEVHVVPLNDLAIGIIAEAKAEADAVRRPGRRKPKSEYVFPSRAGGGAIGYLGNADHALKEAGCTWQGHDLRRTAATVMSELGVTRFVQDRILNHVDATVGSRYDRYAHLAEKREALDKWGDHLAAVLAGGQKKGA